MLSMEISSLTLEVRVPPSQHFELCFCEFIPNDLHSGTLYISMEYGTAIHLCACGCGEKVITPLAPKQWHLFYDGESVSLKPSIGNWSFPCRSHYWILESKVSWAAPWEEYIAAEVEETTERLVEPAAANRAHSGFSLRRVWAAICQFFSR